jgi:MFS family permease
MCLFAVVVGTAIACLGAISNVFLIQGTTVANRARYFCALHASYGFGSFLGPLIVSMIVAKNGYPWPWVFVICIPYLVLLMVLFSRLNPHERAGEVPPLLKKLSKVQVTILSTFALYVVGEVLTSMWMIPVYGVTDRAIADLDTGNVTVQGVVNIECASAVTAKDKVTTDTSGKAVTWTAAGGRALVGVALTTTTTSGQLVLVALTGPGAYGIS